MGYNLNGYKERETLEVRTTEEFLIEYERLKPIMEQTKKEYSDSAKHVRRTSCLADVIGCWCAGDFLKSFLFYNKYG